MIYNKAMKHRRSLHKNIRLSEEKSFTLIELLVVISIISLLSSVVLSSIGSARRRADDAKVLSEYNQVRISLELYRNEHGKYPTLPIGVYCIGDCKLQGTTGLPALGTALTSAGQPGFTYTPKTKIVPSASTYGFAYRVTNTSDSAPKRLIFSTDSKGLQSTDTGVWTLSTGSN
jgi:prepilin-type N-terminal cleavage/methylation domain-containing protein